MTVKECYEEIGGDYEEILSRLMRDDLVKEFAAMFLDDSSYEELVTQMKKGNCEEAFKASHTLKGVCQNLALTELANASSEMTEALRNKDMTMAESLMKNVKKSYKKTKEGILALLAQ